MIQATEVEKSYGPVRALGPVSFTLPAGSQVALTGESGSGKSTLLNLLGCMDLPTRGSITFDGVATAGLSDRALANHRLATIGYVHQFFDLVGDLTAQENVELPLWMARQGPDSAGRSTATRAREGLEKLGLGHRLHQPAAVLSGGEQQRVAIARALIMRPRLILADEPSGSLDSRTGEQVIDLLIASAHELGATLLMATHSTAAADRFALRLALRDGKLMSAPGYAGSPELNGKPS